MLAAAVAVAVAGTGSTWCPVCGPYVEVDEDGDCAACGATATGEGADQAMHILADQTLMLLSDLVKAVRGRTQLPGGEEGTVLQAGVDAVDFADPAPAEAPLEEQLRRANEGVASCDQEIATVAAAIKGAGATERDVDLLMLAVEDRARFQILAEDIEALRGVDPAGRRQATTWSCIEALNLEHGYSVVECRGRFLWLRTIRRGVPLDE